MDGELIVHIAKLAELRQRIPKWLLDQDEPDFSQINLDFLPFMDTNQKVIMQSSKYGREYRGTVEAHYYYNPPTLCIRYCKGWGHYYFAQISLNDKLVGIYRNGKAVYFDQSKT